MANILLTTLTYVATDSKLCRVNEREEQVKIVANLDKTSLE
jgi:hypothetical protein